MNSAHLKLPILLIALLTTACGITSTGGGGGGSSVPNTPAPTPTPSPNPNPSPIVYDTEEYKQNPSLAQMNVQKAYLNGITGEGVIVAVIDAGVTEIPELAGQLHPDSTNIATGNAADTNDYNGHGTAMAAIIAANQDHGTNNNSNNMHGVAFNSKILAINATTAATCTDFSNCTFLHSDIANGFDYAIAHGATVINESLGSDSPSSSILVEAMKRAVSADIVIVVPAGNIDVGVDPAGTGDSAQNSAAVAYSAWANGQIIIAGSVDDDNQLSSFSYKAGNAAKDVFLVAGGNSITAPEHDASASNTYISISGTSGSAAQISGAVALLREAFPSLTAAQTADILFTTATDLGDPGTDIIYGRGLVDLDEAFTSQGMSVIAGTGNGSGSIVGLNGGISSQNMVLSGGAFGSDISFANAFSEIMVLDKYDRSFTADLSHGVYYTPAALSLENFVESSSYFKQHSFNLNDTTTMKLAWKSDDRFSEINKRYFSNHNLKEKNASDLRMSLSFDLGDGKRTKLATGMSIAEMIDDYRPDDYMAPNKHGFSSLVSAKNNKAISFKTPFGNNSSYEVAYSFSDVNYDPLLVGQNINVKNTYMVNRINHQPTDNMSLSFDLGMLQEKGSVLGSVSRGAIEIGKGAKTAFAGAKMILNISDKVQFYANATYGITDVDASANSILGQISTLKSQSYLVGLKTHSLLTNKDLLSLTLSQPLRLVGGNATISNVLSRNYDTNEFIMSYTNIGLSPSGNERDIELSYAIRNIYGASVRLNLLHQINPGHISEIPDATSLLLRFGSAF